METLTTPRPSPQSLIDWSQPQRQPWGGFLITALKVLKALAKMLWPIILIEIFGGKGEHPGRRTLGVLIFISVLLLFSLVLALLHRQFFRFYIDGGELQIRKGWLNKKTISIPLERVQSVEIDEDLLHRAFRLVKLRVDTAGSSKAEAEIEAIRRPMAEALRDVLLRQSGADTAGEAQEAPRAEPVLRLSPWDLIRLSLTANHLEAFALLLTFGWGIYDDLRPLTERLFPGHESLAAAGMKALMALGIVVVLVTLAYSTLRTVVRFFDYHLWRSERGFSARYGLIDRRQRLVPFEKIQFLKWHANWLRRFFGLWILELGVTGEEQIKGKHRLEVPLTQLQQARLIAPAYHPIPDVSGAGLRIHRSYPARLTLLMGLLPALVPAVLTAVYSGWAALYWLTWPALIALLKGLRQQKFRAWADSEALFIRGGHFGESFRLLKWYKIQSLTLSQSPYQRSHGLATLTLKTAAGKISLPWIALEEAQLIADYALFQVESQDRKWM